MVDEGGLGSLKGGIVVLVFIVILGGAGAIALDAFQDDLIDDSTNCSTTDVTGCGYAYNISGQGLSGVDNATSYVPTIGTLLGVGALIGVVIGAFYFMRQ